MTQSDTCSARPMQQRARGSAARASVAHTLCTVAAVLGTILNSAAARAQCPPAWVPGIGTPGVSDEVRAMVVLPFGDVIVGGHVFMAGGGPVSNVAAYSQASGEWSALGGGTNGPVNALARVSGGSVIVGGQFNIAGGVSGCNNIARLNPATGQWQALGGGTNGPVNYIDDFAVTGNIIVGGSFTMAGGAPASSIARYDLSTGAWTPLAVQIDGDVHAMLVLPFGDVIIGGHVLTAGGAPAGNIIRYNLLNDAWTTMGAAPDGDVSDLLLLPGGDVLAFFDAAHGQAGAWAAARYSPANNTWSQVPIPMTVDSDIHAGLVLPFGDVIIGGHVRTVAGGPVSTIVRYNPIANTLSTLGAGTNGDVNALALLPGGDVLVGGGFTQAGGAAANRLARYFPGATPAAIEIHPVTVVVCPSQSAEFSVTAAGTGPFTFQWQFEDANAPGGWVDLTNGPFPGVGTVTGVGTSDISIAEPLVSVAVAAALSFHCIVTNACGSTTSNPAQLFVDPSDIGRQGGLPGRDSLHDNNDFVVYIDLFFNQQPAADLGKQGGLLGSDGQFDNNDFVVFIDQFFTAC